MNPVPPRPFLGGTGHVISAPGREHQIICQNERLAVSGQAMTVSDMAAVWTQTGQWAWIPQNTTPASFAFGSSQNGLQKANVKEKGKRLKMSLLLEVF